VPAVELPKALPARRNDVTAGESEAAQGVLAVLVM